MSVRCLIASLVIAGCCPWLAWCDDGDQAATSPAPPKEVELFAAIESGEIQVAVVPQNFSLMLLRVRNKTSETLKVQLPETLAAIPTARRKAQQQLQQQGMPPNLAHNYPPAQGSSQGLGFSLAGPWAEQKNASGQESAIAGAGNDRPKGSRAWTLAPGELMQVQVPCFCLEYGRPDPNRRIPYELVELKNLNSQPAVEELLRRFGQGMVDQRVAQLAAWHVANGVSWPMLARMKFPRSAGRAAGVVTQEDLLSAQELCQRLPSYDQVPSLSGVSQFEAQP
jgi:hypothetical protein